MLIQVTLCVDTSRTLVRGTTSSITHVLSHGFFSPLLSSLHHSLPGARDSPNLQARAVLGGDSFGGVLPRGPPEAWFRGNRKETGGAHLLVGPAWRAFCTL